VTSVKVIKRMGVDDVPLMDVKLDGPQFEWPSDATSLTPDVEYQVVFIFGDTTAPPTRLAIVVRALAGPNDAAALTLIGFD
jgi:hypothetical protein